MTPEQQAEADRLKAEQKASEEKAAADKKTRDDAAAADKKVRDDAEVAERARNAHLTGDSTGNAESKARDADLEAHRDNVTVNNPRAPEAVAKQHQETDALNDKRNEENRPGHEKNMERVEAEAQEAQARTQHADHHLAGHVPTGKERNRNTPRVLADGTKVWDQ